MSENRNQVAIADELILKLRQGIAQSRASTVIASGKPFLRLLKSGQWVFGQRDDEVQVGSSWCLNPLSILHGWVCWSNDPNDSKNTKLGEVSAPVHEPKPQKPDPVRGFQYAEQRVMDLKCLDGDDAGMEITYTCNSIGGMRAVDELLGALQAQLATDPLHPCPVIQLDSEYYNHTKYGRIYTPVLTVVDWATMNGELASVKQVAAQPAPAPAASPAPAAAKPAKAPIVKVVPAPTEPAPTAAVRTPGTPRRRPTAA